MMYQELVNFKEELKWYSAVAYNKEFLVDETLVSRSSTSTYQVNTLVFAFDLNRTRPFNN